MKSVKSLLKINLNKVHNISASNTYIMDFYYLTRGYFLLENSLQLFAYIKHSK